MQSLTMSPWSRHKPSGPVGLLEAPVPVIEERQEGPEPREPFRLGTGGIGEEAEKVADHDESYEPTEVNSPTSIGGTSSIVASRRRTIGKVDTYAEKVLARHPGHSLASTR